MATERSVERLYPFAACQVARRWRRPPCGHGRLWHQRAGAFNLRQLDRQDGAVRRPGVSSRRERRFGVRSEGPPRIALPLSARSPCRIPKTAVLELERCVASARIQRGDGEWHRQWAVSRRCRNSLRSSRRSKPSMFPSTCIQRLRPSQSWTLTSADCRASSALCFPLPAGAGTWKRACIACD